MNPKAIRHLSIPQPCAENWSAMARTESGDRFCASCQHAVFDLTTRSDAEVLRLAAARDGRLCGQITTAQLDRINRGLAVRVRPVASPRWPATVLLLIGLSLAAPAATFARPPLAVQIQFAADLKPVAEVAPGDTVIINGRVTDANTGEAVIGAWVRIQGTSLGMETTVDGSYSLIVPVPDSIAVTLQVFASHDYYSREWRVELSSGDPSMAINLEIQPRYDEGTLITPANRGHLSGETAYYIDGYLGYMYVEVALGVPSTHVNAVWNNNAAWRAPMRQRTRDNSESGDTP